MARFEVYISDEGLAAIDGAPLVPAPGQSVHEAVLDQLQRYAVARSEVVEATVTDRPDTGHFVLEVSPDGSSRLLTTAEAEDEEPGYGSGSGPGPVPTPVPEPEAGSGPGPGPGPEREPELEAGPEAVPGAGPETEPGVGPEAVTGSGSGVVFDPGPVVTGSGSGVATDPGPVVTGSGPGVAVDPGPVLTGSGPAVVIHPSPGGAADPGPVLTGSGPVVVTHAGPMVAADPGSSGPAVGTGPGAAVGTGRGAAVATGPATAVATAVARATAAARAAAPALSPAPAPDRVPPRVPAVSLPAELAGRISRINALAVDGRLDEAYALATELREGLTGTVGAEDPHAVEARAVEAYIAHLCGDHREAIVLALAVARIRCRAGDLRAPEEVARAAAAWQWLDDERVAVAHGRELLHMWDRLGHRGLLPPAHAELAGRIRRRVDALEALV